MDGEQQAIQHLIELTNGDADEDVARSTLASVDWDVQRAADLIFGHAPSSSSATMQPFDVDDSHQASIRPRQPVGRPLWTWLTLPFHLLGSIVRFIFGVLRIPLPRFATLTFYLPLSRARRGPSSSAPPKGPEAWLRQLEDETGAISVGRIHPRASASGVASSTATSSTTDASLTSRSRAAGDDDQDTDGRKRLPDFMLTSYEDFLRACQRDARIGCVILVSAEHDDVAEFKRTTLTDPTLIKAFQDNNILVWGGDVRDREAWSASEKLQATTYPFVAFIALQPQRGTRSSSLIPSTSSNSSPSGEPTLTVLSRHQGPAVASAYYPTPPSSSSNPSNPSSATNPADDATPTSARALLAHLRTSLLPRVLPFLTHHHTARVTQRTALERARQLRAEQDAAFALSAARDRARIEARVQVEAAERERVRQEKEDEERRVREERKRLEERERRERERAGWRTWMRGAIVRPLKESSAVGVGAGAKGKASTLRVAVRLPNGARIVHSFDLYGSTSSAPAPTLTTLFALVDTAFIPDSSKQADDPSLPPSTPASSASHTYQTTPTSPESTLDAYILSLLSPSSSNKPTAESTFWAFRLLTAYPRAELPWSASTPLRDVPLLNPAAAGASGKNVGAGGAQLVVELVSSDFDGENGPRRRSGESARRSGESGRKSMESTGRRSGESVNGNGLVRGINGNGYGYGGAGGSGKGKGREDEKAADKEEEDGEDSDDGYKTESSDED